MSSSAIWYQRRPRTTPKARRIDLSTPADRGRRSSRPWCVGLFARPMLMSACRVVWRSPVANCRAWPTSRPDVETVDRPGFCSCEQALDRQVARRIIRALLALDSNRDLLDGSPSQCAVRGAQAGGECKHDDEKDGAQEDGRTDVGYGGVGSSEAVR